MHYKTSNLAIVNRNTAIDTTVLSRKAINKNKHKKSIYSANSARAFVDDDLAKILTCKNTVLPYVDGDRMLAVANKYIELEKNSKNSPTFTEAIVIDTDSDDTFDDIELDFPTSVSSDLDSDLDSDNDSNTDNDNDDLNIDSLSEDDTSSKRSPSRRKKTDKKLNNRCLISSLEKSISCSESLGSINKANSQLYKEYYSSLPPISVEEIQYIDIYEVIEQLIRQEVLYNINVKTPRELLNPTDIEYQKRKTLFSLREQEDIIISMCKCV